MTGAGAPGGPGILQCLQGDNRIRLIVGDANPRASGRFLADNFQLLPKADSKDFIQQIVAICHKEKIDLIFPLVTRELFLFAQHKDLLATEGIKVIVSDSESLFTANDKSALYTHLSHKGILLPAFSVVKTIEELESAFRSLGYPQEPLCIKPSISNGSRGVRIIDETLNEYDLLFNHKPNSLYMTYDKLLSILASKPFPELLVSEVLPGDEYTIDTLVKNGETKVVLPRIRSKMNGGISVEGQFLYHEEIINYCRQINNTMKLNGPIGLQVKQARDGAFKLLEINPRIQGTSVAAMGLGINLPLLAVLQETMELEYPNQATIPWGTCFARYYSEVYYESGAV